MHNPRNNALLIVACLLAAFIAVGLGLRSSFAGYGAAGFSPREAPITSPRPRGDMIRMVSPRGPRGSSAALGMRQTSERTVLPRTDWQVGDPIVYRQGCHTLEAARAALTAYLARRHDPRAYDRCFRVNVPLPAVLRERIESYATPRGTVSIWKILDITGATEWIVIPDARGTPPHPSPPRIPPKVKT